QAYLMQRNGSAAAAEFQKIIDHRGIVWAIPLGALAHLQLGRAYAMQGDTAKSRAAYQDFLTLWKDADPDIPIFKQAKAEYAKLHLGVSGRKRFSPSAAAAQSLAAGSRSCPRQSCTASRRDKTSPPDSP